MSARAMRILVVCLSVAVFACAGCTTASRATLSRGPVSVLPREVRCPAGRVTVCDERVRLSLDRGASSVERRLGYVSEVVEACDGAAVAVRQLFGEFSTRQLSGDRGASDPAPADVRGLQVHLRSRGDAPAACVLVGVAPSALTRFPRDAAFEDCLPTAAVGDGDSWTLTDRQSAAWGRRLDPLGGSSDDIVCTLQSTRLCRRPTSGGRAAVVCEPLKCAIISFRWKHTGDVFAVEGVRAELAGTLWVDLKTGLIVRRTCWGTLRRKDAGVLLGTLNLEHTAWPISARQFARYRERRAAPAGPVELPSGLIFRAAAPAGCWIPIG